MGECSKGYKHTRFLIPAKLPAHPLLVVVVQPGNNYNIPFDLSRYKLELLFIRAYTCSIFGEDWSLM
jgi:hypothetical protein